MLGDVKCVHWGMVGEGWVTHNICVFTLYIVDLANIFVQVNTFIVLVTYFGGPTLILP